MSLRKIAGYGLVMCFTLGTTGYLIYKNFIVPYLGVDEAAAPTSSVIEEETITDGQSAETAIKENLNTDSKKTAGKPIDIFVNEKFINLKSGAIIESEINPQVVGKKNIFEPYDPVKEAGSKTDKLSPAAASSSLDDSAEE